MLEILLFCLYKLFIRKFTEIYKILSSWLHNVEIERIVITSCFDTKVFCNRTYMVEQIELLLFYFPSFWVQDINLIYIQIREFSLCEYTFIVRCLDTKYIVIYILCTKMNIGIYIEGFLYWDCFLKSYKPTLWCSFWSNYSISNQEFYFYSSFESDSSEPKFMIDRFSWP